MNAEEKYRLAIEHLANYHCVLTDDREIKSPQYCPFLEGDENMTCEKCWAWYIESGRWWDKETEPDPDRKWKEIHGE